MDGGDQRVANATGRPRPWRLRPPPRLTAEEPESPTAPRAKLTHAVPWR
ncbi:hypothetical protein LEMLEM_LOCUS22000, partial [Lemmus lemmus]